MSETNTRIIFCRIGWAKNYDGNLSDIPKNGGEFNKKNIGFEFYNFKEYSGIYYGYVKMAREKSIRIERIDESARNREEIDDVLVVWVAKRKDFGAVIVGWYKNATVFRKYKTIPSEVMSNRNLKDHNIYNISSENVTLLDESKRTFLVGGIGQSNIWYDEENIVSKNVVEYINNFK